MSDSSAQYTVLAPWLAKRLGVRPGDSVHGVKFVRSRLFLRALLAQGVVRAVEQVPQADGGNEQGDAEAQSGQQAGVNPEQQVEGGAQASAETSSPTTTPPQARLKIPKAPRGKE